MTRWTFYLILNDFLLNSIEFNGDMYPPEGEWAWYWDEALSLLSSVSTKEEFDEMIKKFNQEHHNYEDVEKFTYEIPVENLKKLWDFTKWYFDFWFSDWIFIKNASNKKHTFIMNDTKQKVILGPGEVIRFNFWCINENDKKRFEKNIKI